MGLTERLFEALGKTGFKAGIVPISYLPELQDGVEGLLKRGLLDSTLYDTYLKYLHFDHTKAMPNVRSMMVVAVPLPITRLQFEWQGKMHPVDLPPSYVFRGKRKQVADILTGVVDTAGYKVNFARLPMKLLAVRSGLAQYGRNNISYVPGMGSYLGLVGFYSDWPSETDTWQEAKALDRCQNCVACVKNCPTQCITNDRFLVHAEKCLTFFNEIPQDFPDWVKSEWHNALFGCMRCQTVCPENKPFVKKIESGESFDGEETGLILGGEPLEKLKAKTREKLEALSLGSYYGLLRRNLGILLNKL